MSELIKIIKQDNKKHHWQFTVKVKFVQTCYWHESLSFYDLMSKTNITDYLHNTVGPAVINLDTGEIEYWDNGKYIEKDTDEWKRIFHIQEFNKKFAKFLED